MRRMVLSWSAKSSSVNSFFLELALKFLGFALIVILLGLFDQAQHVTHAENPRSETVRMEHFEGVELLAHTTKQDRRARDGPHRQCGTAACIAIEFGQDQSGNLELVVKALRDVDRVLTGHCVGHQYGVMRIAGDLQPHQLFHQFVVDLQTASGIDQQRIEAADLGAHHCAADDLDRVVGLAALDHRHANLRAEHAQLFHRGGSPHVG